MTALVTLLMIVLAIGVQESGPMASASRGIAGVVEFELPGPPSRVRPVRSPTEPMIVRVLETTPGGDGSTRYRLAFLGMVAGEYDLTPLLERPDGSAIEGQPIVVRVVSQLPADHGAELFSDPVPRRVGSSGYRVGLIMLVIAWLAIPAVYVAVRAARRRSTPEAQAEAPVRVTLADQLRPLAQAAVAGQLSLQERARLELLLYKYWRKKLGFSGSQAEAVATLRRDPQAGELLRAVERWLHAPQDGTFPKDEASTDQQIAELLEPYRTVEAIDDGAPSGPAAVGGTA